MTKRKVHGGHDSNRDARKQKKQRNESNERIYTVNDVILVLGDGDFTFSKGLVTHRGGGMNLFATSFDSTSEVREKYSNANECIGAVIKQNAQVYHSIDATKLDMLPTQLPSLFDYILFNFPHSGQQRVHINRVLLLDFFESARPKLKFKGQVHITLKTKPPYSNWNVEVQAKASGFVLKERRPFRIDVFPGYNHRTTDPTAKTFEPDQCVTYVFIVDRSKYPVPTIEKPISNSNEPALPTNAESPLLQTKKQKKKNGLTEATTKQAFKDALMQTTKTQTTPSSKKSEGNKAKTNEAAKQAFKDALMQTTTTEPFIPSTLMKSYETQEKAIETDKVIEGSLIKTNEGNRKSNKNPLATVESKKLKKTNPDKSSKKSTTHAASLPSQVEDDIHQLCLETLRNVRRKRLFGIK